MPSVAVGLFERASYKRRDWALKEMLQHAATSLSVCLGMSRAMIVSEF